MAANVCISFGHQHNTAFLLEPSDTPHTHTPASSEGVKTLVGPDRCCLRAVQGFQWLINFPPGTREDPSPFTSSWLPHAALPTALSPADLPALVMIISVPASWNFFHSSFSCSPTLMFSMVWGWEEGELVGLADPQPGSTRSLPRVERRPTNQARRTCQPQSPLLEISFHKIILSRWRI